MSNLTIYHGSSEIIKTPEYRKGTVYDDYGQGFYCTEHIELAKEWACTENTDGFVNKYEIDISSLNDVIIGYRADDSYFSFARAFVNNEISLKQLSYAMRLGNHGEQFVLKSRKAFDCINFTSYEPADSTIYYTLRKARDEKARNAFFAELENDDADGIFMRDITREEIKPDDLRLR